MVVPTNQVFLQGSVTPISADSLNSLIQVVGSVALLRTFTGVNNQVIWLEGTTSVNDGGQALYYFNAASVAADNGGTVIAPTGSTIGRWLEQPISSGAGTFSSLTISGTITLAGTTTISSDGTTITIGGQFATTGTATLADLAVTATHSASNVLAVGSSGAGAPTWHQLAYADISGLGSMAQQAASAVAVTGGTINGTAIGGSTPAAGSFTTVSATSTVQAGAAGLQGTLIVYPAITSRGTLQITTASNTGNTTTTINAAAQAGARTYTLPDQGGNASFLMTGATLGGSGLAGLFQVPLTTGLTSAGIPMTASATSANFGVSLTVGTSLVLTTNAANSSTVTNTVVWEIVLPPNYIAAQNVTCTVNANYVLGSGTIGTHTLTMTAYLCANVGTQGANLIATGALPVPAAAGDLVSTITGTTLSPGSRIILQGLMVVQDTGGHAVTGQINSVRLS